ncbi:MAG: alpha/beta fold hydrolase [Alphaproteobacteria bacterium]
MGNDGTTMIRANGIALRCRLEGAGDPLVLIHGVGGRLEAWDGVVSHLARRYRILRYDLRGHGESEKAAGPYDIADFVEDLNSLVAAAGLARCHVAGFSLGGLVAQGFALGHAAKLDKLALISTVAGRSEAEKAAVLARLKIVEGGIPGDHFRRSIERWFTDEFRARNPALIADYAARNMANDPKCYAAAYGVLATTDFADRLAEITAPTLVMTGEDDVGSNPRMARLMHERIANSTLHILPKLRHSILIEAPETVARILGSFLSARPQPWGPGKRV